MNDNLAGASPVDQPVGRLEPERAEDRVLLGLAGAAADCGVRWEVDYGCYSVPSEHGPRRWNPLADDGDALRLANKLWLQIRHVHGKAHAGMPDRFWCTELWFPDGDQDAATRRAIVRAAAEIGRAMP